MHSSKEEIVEMGDGGAVATDDVVAEVEVTSGVEC